jgi:hypothetical protein
VPLVTPTESPRKRASTSSAGVESRSFWNTDILTDDSSAIDPTCASSCTRVRARMSTS